MSNTSDYIISNQAGSGFRNELNQVLNDIKTLNSGSNEPTSRTPWMLWADTGNNLLKVRNGSNNAWITLGSLGSNMGMALLSEANQQNFTGPIQATEFISNSTGRLKMPVGTTGQQPSSAVQGDTRFNSTLKLLETFSGSAWLSMFSGAHLEVYGTAGTYTYSPPEGRTQFLVVCTGGGGGGAGVTVHGSSGAGTNYWGASGGGGAGTAIRQYTLAELGSSATAVVGRGGNAGLSRTNNGDNGVSSTFSPTGTGSGSLTLTGELGTGSSVGYLGSTDAKAMSRPGWPGHGVNGEVNCSGEKAEFQTINNYTGTTATGFDMAYMNSSGGGSFWGKGPGSGGNGVWSNGGSTNSIDDAYGKEGKPGVIIVLSW